MLHTDRRPIRTPPVFPSLVLIAALACSAIACGRSGTGSSSSSSSASGASGGSSSGVVNACALLTPADIAAIVGNPVKPGREDAGPEVCKWDVEVRGQVDVLVQARAKGSVREQALCPDLAKTEATKRVPGVGDVATMESSSVMGLFNSAELQACGPKGFIAVMLNGEKDQATLRDATLKVAQKVFAADWR